MKKKKKSSLDDIRNLKGAPLNYRFIREVESDPTARNIAKFAESTFHSTTKYRLTSMAKPISRLINHKNEPK